MDPETRHVGGTLHPMTPLHHAQILGRHLRIPNLYLKVEASGSTGSAKDRIASVHVAAAVDAGKSTLTAVSTGSYGVALAHQAKKAGLGCVIFVSSDHAGRRIEEMRREGATVERFDGDYVETVQESRERAAKEGWYDANPGATTLPRSAGAYSVIATEIVAALGRAPSTVAVPTRNGTLLVGLYRGFEELVAKGHIRQAPRLIAASTKMGNPIVWSLAHGDETAVDLSSKDVWPHPASESLSTSHAFDGSEAVGAVRATNGWGYAAGDAELLALAQQLARTEKIQALPASLASIAALHFAAKFERLEADGVHVAVLTARP